MMTKMQVWPLLCVLCVANIAAAAEPKVAAPSSHPEGQNVYKVLFIGNSHLFVNDVPAQVREHLRVEKGQVEIQTFASGGARLAHFTERADVVVALKNTRWDVVVLQEASSSFLSNEGRRNFHQSVDWFTRQLPTQTRIVLYQTWPWQSGSRYFRERSSNEAEMWATMRTEYAKMARRSRILIAPVGQCWINSPHRAAYYSTDGNHASAAGSSLAATVISKTITNGLHVGC